MNISPKQVVANTRGVDVYHGDAPVNFKSLYADGIRFCYAKATQGTSVTDPMYHRYRSDAKSAGMMFGAYHFFTDAPPEDQAKHFLDVASISPGDLLPWLDVETDYTGVGANARLAADYIKSKLKQNPIIYASDSFYSSYLSDHFQNFTIAIARYSGSPHNQCKFWQNSETGRLNGEPHYIDTDVFFGTEADLKTEYTYIGQT